jgi:hypothetical protein
MIRSSCLCGDVTWEIDGEFEWMAHCHCSRCRKAHGSAFATAVSGDASRFRLHGAENVVRWEGPSGFARTFCRRCGAKVPGDPSDGRVFLPAGNFLDDPGIVPVVHIFVGSKAPWYEITDELPRFDAYPEGFDFPVLPDRPPLDPPGKPRGSCLCSAVTYVVEGQPIRAMNCHCSRCRRVRSAAHASNFFTTEDGVRFTRGEDNRTTYKPPDARYFTNFFCKTCGSPVPRVDEERHIAIVPMGTLDDDVGLRPQAHIFVDSKAPWFTISGDLPQYPEGPPPLK